MNNSFLSQTVKKYFHCRFFSLMRYNNVIINLRLQLHSNKCRNRRDNTIMLDLTGGFLFYIKVFWIIYSKPYPYFKIKSLALQFEKGIRL